MTKIKKLGMLLFTAVMIASCAEKTTDEKSSEEANKSEEEVNLVKTEEDKVKTGSSSPKTSKPVSELEPVDESERHSEVKIVPNRYPMEQIKKENDKKKKQEEKSKDKGDKEASEDESDT